MGFVDDEEDITSLAGQILKSRAELGQETLETIAVEGSGESGTKRETIMDQSKSETVADLEPSCHPTAHPADLQPPRHRPGADSSPSAP